MSKTEPKQRNLDREPKQGKLPQIATNAKQS